MTCVVGIAHEGKVYIGGDIARGALFASLGAEPAERIRIALEASERFSAGVRGPFHLEQA